VTPDAASPPPPYAGVATRGVAIVVDIVIIDVLTVVGVAIASLVLSTIIPGDHSLGVPEIVTAGAVWLISVGGYFVGFWSLVGRTPGMRLMRLEVRADDGGDVSFARASLRFVGLIIAAIPLGLGFLLALVDDRRQGLQDKIGGTVVLYVAARVRGVVVAAVPDPAAARHDAAGPGEVIEGTVVPPGARPA
jgi:uncharacterized RDD family membrane protein YckC